LLASADRSCPSPRKLTVHLSLFTRMVPTSGTIKLVRMLALLFRTVPNPRLRRETRSTCPSQSQEVSHPHVVRPQTRPRRRRRTSPGRSLLPARPRRPANLSPELPSLPRLLQPRKRDSGSALTTGVQISTKKRKSTSARSTIKRKNTSARSTIRPRSTFLAAKRSPLPNLVLKNRPLTTGRESELVVCI